MSHYKHVFNAINNTLHHLKQAQDYCDDLKPIDKVACGTWKKELKTVEKQLSGCFKTVEGKHKKAANTMKNKTASYEEEMFNDDWDIEYDDDYMDYWSEEEMKTEASSLERKKYASDDIKIKDATDEQIKSFMEANGYEVSSIGDESGQKKFIFKKMNNPSSETPTGETHQASSHSRLKRSSNK